MADPSKPLASIIPTGDELIAELYALSSSVGFIRPGQTVLVRLPAYPYQKFGQLQGTVQHVSRTSLPATELPGAAVADPRDSRVAEPLYRVSIRLNSQAIRAYGADIPLQAGMTVEASVFQDKRALYEWALEPLYSITGKL